MSTRGMRTKYAPAQNRETGAEAKASHPRSVLSVNKNVSYRVVIDMTTSVAQGLKDLQWAVGINLFASHATGIGINLESTGWLDAIAKRRVLLYFTVLLIFLSIPQSTALLTVWGHLFLMTDNLKLSFLFFVVELELMTLWNKNEGLATMWEYVKSDWIRLKTERERNVMLKYGKQSRKLTIGAYIIVIFTILSDHIPCAWGHAWRTLTNLTDFGDRPFVMQTIYPFDAYVSPIYEMIAVSQFIAGSIGGLCYTTVGTLFGVVVLHVSGQLENLYNRIEDMVNGDDHTNFQHDFKLTVQEHVRLIRFLTRHRYSRHLVTPRFAEMVENTFSLMLLEIASVFALIVCLQGYQIALMLGDDIDRPFMQVAFGITYVANIIFVAFVYSAVGDTLVTQSENIQYATYNCEWHKLSPRQALQFIPMLVRSQRPLSITAGKFATITLSTFVTLLKTTAGYISCLLAVQ